VGSSTPKQSRLKTLEDFDVTWTPEGSSYSLAHDSDTVFTGSRSRLFTAERSSSMFSSLDESLSTIDCSWDQEDDNLSLWDSENNKLLYSLALESVSKLRTENETLKNELQQLHSLHSDAHQVNPEPPNDKIDQLLSELASSKKELQFEISERKRIQIEKDLMEEELKSQLLIQTKACNSLRDDLDSRDQEIAEIRHSSLKNTTQFDIELDSVKCELVSLKIEYNRVVEECKTKELQLIDELDLQRSVIFNKNRKIQEYEDEASSMEAELVRVVSNFNEKTAQIDVHCNQISSLQSSNREHELKTSQLSDELEGAEMKVGTMQVELNNLAVERDELVAKLVEVKRSAQLVQQIELELLPTIKGLEEKLADSNANLISVQIELDTLKQSHYTLSKKSDHLIRQNADLQSRDACQQQFLDSSRHHADEISEELSASSCKLGDAQMEIESLRNELNYALEQIADKHISVETLKSRLKLVEKEKEILAQENIALSKLNVEIGILRSELAIVQKSEGIIQRENAGLLGTVAEKDLQIRGLSASKTEIEEEMLRVIDKCTADKSLFRALEASNCALEIKIATLNERMMELVDESAVTMSVKSEMQSELFELRCAVDGMRKETGVLKTELRKWSEVHKINREAIAVFKERVERKVLGLMSQRKVLRKRCAEAVELTRIFVEDCRIRKVVEEDESLTRV